MFPDYLKAKTEIDKVMYSLITQEREPLLLGAKSAPIHEGNRGRVIRENGTQDEYRFQRHSATIEITDEEYEKLTFQELIERVREAGKEMGMSMAQQMLEKVDEATKLTGNRVDMQGTLSTNKFFEVLRKIEIPFNKNGQPEWPTIVAGDIGAEGIQILLNKIAKTPELNKEMESVISEKREQWRDRENRRKLVG